MTRVAFAGYAQSQVERHSERTLGDIAIETALAAIADAGLSPGDIDGFASSALFASAGSHTQEDGVHIVSSKWLAENLRVQPRYLEGFVGMGQIPGSINLAVKAIESGAADYVLVHRALHNPKKGSYHGNSMQAAPGPMQWTAPQGYFGPLAMIGFPYREYLERYGASPDTMGLVVAEARKNGARLPWSVWHNEPLGETEYADSPMIVDPIRRLDCDMPVDGVAAFILTSAERAADMPHRPVHIEGISFAPPQRHRLMLHWPLEDIYDAGAVLAKQLWETTGWSPTDVELPQLYDGFTPFVYFWLEVLGFCPTGEAHRLVLDGGIDSDQPGSLPVLSSGGAIGNGRMHGVPQLLECYLQLSGRAGERQRDVSRGLACHASPHMGGVVALSAGAR